MKSKFFCIVGKSASGKDTLFRAILDTPKCDFTPVIPYTTRPMRDGETNGVEYNFVTEQEFLGLLESDGVIEERCYNTNQGLWYYFTPKFEPADGVNYIMITTLDGARSMCDYFGYDEVVTVCLEASDRTILSRSIERESKNANPDYSEVCRRFIADKEDFAADQYYGLGTHLEVLDSDGSIEDLLFEWDYMVREILHQ